MCASFLRCGYLQQSRSPHSDTASSADVDVTKTKSLRHTGQPCAEHKRFGPIELLTQPVKELQDDSAIELHRAADIRDQHQRTRLVFSLSARKIDDDTAQLRRPPEGFAMVQHARPRVGSSRGGG